MRILLTQNVQGLGKAGQVKEVHDGYARNYLIPRGLAVPATEAEMKKRETLERVRASQEAKQAAANQKLAERIAATPITFKVKVGEQYRLFGSITAADIAEELGRRLGEPIDRHKLELGEPIKHVGTFKVPLHLSHDLQPEVTVIVEPEQP